MARKLKTYQTSLGFFDLAIAAPSMKAALEKRRERERATEEATRRKERERRQQAVDKAQAALDEAEREHAKTAAAIQTQVEALEKKSRAEDARWDKEMGRLEDALRRARG
jgi:hypothetical protein